MGKRRQAREVALQLLYAIEITQEEVTEMLASAWVGTLLTEETRDFVTRLALGAAAHRSEIDGLIQTWSANWSLDRIAFVERNILRMALYELLYMPEIPPKVTINEAVEIAKRYGAEDAPAFVNGILDRINHEVIRRPETVSDVAPDYAQYLPA
jgi:transcription antitermination protein NusB